jgi:hypothetical protein
MLLDLSASTSYPRLLTAFAVFAAGFGLVNPPITNAAVSGMPRSQSGVAAAFASTSRQVGAALGVAVIGAILNAGGDTAPGSGIVAHARAAEAVVVGCGLAVVVLGVATTTSAARRSAARTAATLGDASVEEPAAPVQVRV